MNNLAAILLVLLVENAIALEDSPFHAYAEIGLCSSFGRDANPSESGMLDFRTTPLIRPTGGIGVRIPIRGAFIGTGAEFLWLGHTTQLYHNISVAVQDFQYEIVQNLYYFAFPLIQGFNFAIVSPVLPEVSCGAKLALLASAETDFIEPESMPLHNRSDFEKVDILITGRLAWRFLQDFTLALSINVGLRSLEERNFWYARGKNFSVALSAGHFLFG